MPSDRPDPKPWSGRFREPTHALVERFTASVDFDRRLCPYDIAGSIAHATMLAEVGVLSDAEREAIVAGLEAIRTDVDAGRFEWRADLEDVHMNVEAELTRRIGEAGKKLHTGRSRNDQVITDLRLMLRDESDAMVAAIRRLQRVIVDLAEREADTIMPGFTHMQSAQPVTFGHHLLAWYEMLARDAERFADARPRINRLPLGSAALAGTGHPIDRALTARLLGFESLCHNSLDAVGDRDFCIEFVSNCALLMVHLSRMSEEIVLWSSTHFEFIELEDAFCTGSSIMPQKKNPDVAELVRGKASRVMGHAAALFALMKSQPLSFNRDNQEDKEAVFDALDTTRECLEVYGAMLPGLKVNRARMHEAATRGFATATDLADYLVRKQVPFRDAHAVVGEAVREGIERGCTLADFRLEELQRLCPRIEPDVYEVLSLEGSVASRDHVGGTAPRQVRRAAARARRQLDGEGTPRARRGESGSGAAAGDGGPPGGGEGIRSMPVEAAPRIAPRLAGEGEPETPAGDTAARDVARPPAGCG